MNYKVLTTPEFDKNVKKLSKKYKNIKNDLSELVLELKNKPDLGISLFNNCFKIR